jgi:hypothetical protein
VRSAAAREEPISPNVAMLAATSKDTQSTFRNRVAVNLRFRFSTIAAAYNYRFSYDRAACQTFESFPSADDSEKCVGSSAMMLLMPQNF